MKSKVNIFNAKDTAKKTSTPYILGVERFLVQYVDPVFFSYVGEPWWESEEAKEEMKKGEASEKEWNDKIKKHWRNDAKLQPTEWSQGIFDLIEEYEKIIEEDPESGEKLKEQESINQFLAGYTGAKFQMEELFFEKTMKETREIIGKTMQTVANQAEITIGRYQQLEPENYLGRVQGATVHRIVLALGLSEGQYIQMVRMEK